MRPAGTTKAARTAYRTGCITTNSAKMPQTGSFTTTKTTLPKTERTSLLKAKNSKHIDNKQNYGYVTCYKYHAPTEFMPIYEFSDADKEWLWFISLNRRQRLAKALSPLLPKTLFASEIIIGKIANDTTNPVITTYLNGLYGSLEDENAAKMAISLLLPNRLKDQYCFLSQRAVNCLEVIEVKKYGN